MAIPRGRCIRPMALPRRHAICLSLLPEDKLLVDGAHVELRPTCMRLVGYLALQSGRPVTRAVASGTLWPDVTAAKASASLRSAIWRLADARTVLVGASTTHVWLDPAVDVDLQAATARATTLIGLDSLGTDDLDLGRDLHHLSSDLLVGWFEDWVLDEQERFRQLRLHALDRLADLLLRAGRPADAVRAAQVAVGSEPLRETAQIALVRAHLAEGNAGEAVRQFRAFADLLDNELGIRPSRVLEQLIGHALDRPAHREAFGGDLLRQVRLS